MTTHPTYDSHYDCAKPTVIEGEKRYHSKGENPTCSSCKKYNY